MKLEVNETHHDDLSLNGVSITPALNADYWLYRVRLTKDQAILGFSKFNTIGIGFAEEEDWNTNLPYSCPAKEIYDHIEHNRGDASITEAECLEAIEMIRQAAIRYLTAQRGAEAVEGQLRRNG